MLLTPAEELALLELCDRLGPQDLAISRLFCRLAHRAAVRSCLEIHGELLGLEDTTRALREADRRPDGAA